MGNILALIVTVLLAVGAIIYIIVAKKRGKTCIGCPEGCCGSKEGKCVACAYHNVCDDEMGTK